MTEEEKKDVPHHLMSFLGLTDFDFSVVRFCEMAREVINDIISRGLYILF